MSLPPSASTSNPTLAVGAASSLYNPKDLALVRRTVASDTTDDEFNLFVHAARALRLDPLRRQVHAFVINKANPKKRRLALVASIEGLRSIAARSGNYRPDEGEPTFVTRRNLKSETNPAGLVSCTVRVWQFSHGEWHRISGTARWDEFAPLKTVWENDQPTDRKVLDRSGKWAEMPRHMLAKVAEAQALRKGWPEDLANCFESEEVERLRLNDLPSRSAQEGTESERLERIGARQGLTIDWLDGSPLDPVPLGQLADRILSFIQERRTSPATLQQWRERNRHALREFWARSPSDALGVKSALEESLLHAGDKRTG